MKNKINQILIDEVERNHNAEKDLICNITDKLALEHINEMQVALKEIKGNIDLMKEKLGKAGFEVEFDRNPFEQKTVRCTVRKKNGDTFLEQFAEVAEGDYPVKLLGKYLSLARATRIILGDYSA